ncbi:HORMA domain protein [Necator americanus]|uniref:HORMA domain protein n=1 Tax=Necator americanus TaxID=51031 RepID=W2SVB5_NECAM|nr:HORMA domain protein [Necator americanus]ETN73689.1 HORMA domain protein [Necator americanus]
MALLLSPKCVEEKPDVSKRWAGTFPEEVSRLHDSTIFITRCMYITFSHILASRRLLPKNVFKTRVIDGDLKACVMDTSDVLGARLVQKFKGINHAVELRYLRELMLVVSATEEDEKDAIEMYTWRLRYDTDGNPEAELRQADGTVMASLRFRGMKYLKKQVTELLVMIRTLCRGTLSPLPSGVSGTLRITYTDRAPRGYQAPGFYRSPEDPVLRSEAQEVEIGSLQTKHHGASVVVQSIFIDDAYAVGLRLKETMKITSLDDSLNESLGEEHGAGDEDNRSSIDDTMERISDGIAQQINVVEIPRSEEVLAPDGPRTILRSDQSDSSNSSRTSLVEVRGSTIHMNESDTSPEDAPPKRPRRGRNAAAKVQPGKPIAERAKSPILVSAAPQIETTTTTPSSRKYANDSHDTPPAKRTPGEIKCSKFTPKEPPTRRRK